MLLSMRYVVISDIHGNFTALNEILKTERYDGIIVLGDIVDYGPEPLECIDAIEDLKPEIWIRGNHDEAVARGIDCGCSSPKLKHLSTFTRENITLKELDESQRKVLGTKPLEVIVGKYSMICVHGSPRNPLYEYFIEPEEDLLRSHDGKYVEQEFILVGHTHFQRIFRIGEHVVINPGSVGQPRDGDPRASYAILDTEEMTYELKRVKYDVEEVSKKLREKIGKYAEELIRILLEGRV